MRTHDESVREKKRTSGESQRGTEREKERERERERLTELERGRGIFIVELILGN